MNIDRSKEYIKFASNFNEQEKSLRSMFEKWLPNKIIDCHVHVGQTNEINELIWPVYKKPFCSFLGFDLENSYKIRNLFYPGKMVLMLRFPYPFQGINHRDMNKYLIKKCTSMDRIALCGIPTDIEYTVKLLSNPRIAALKMHYYSSVPPAKEIYQFFPKAILEAAQSKALPIILHLPLKASHCIDQVERLVYDFPNLQVVLAHLGGYMEPLEKLELAYKSFAKYKSIHVDTAMVFSSQAIGLALKYFGEGRILYGSDEPLDLLRVKMYEHPVLGFRLISEYPYHWIPHEEYETYKYLAHGIVHAHWQTLLAIKQAIQGLPKSRQETAKSRIFFDNSKKLFSFG